MKKSQNPQRKNVKTRQEEVHLRGNRPPVNNSLNFKKLKMTTGQQIMKSGDFVAVGLKPKKGPISVYIAEVMHIGEEVCGLKYMRKKTEIHIYGLNQ